MSEDAGKSFATVGGFNGAHGDVHDVWIDPTNTQVVINGDDGGIWYSHDGGGKWWKGEGTQLPCRHEADLPAVGRRAVPTNGCAQKLFDRHSLFAGRLQFENLNKG